MLNARQFAPQLAVFQNTHLGSAIMQANEFAIKERHMHPDCPMPLLKPAGDGTVTVIYFVEIPSLEPTPENLRMVYTGQQPDVSKGWWPDRLKQKIPKI